jgi:hypothetical protein
MHCISVSSPSGQATWRIRQSVEVLGYHRKERRVSILFLLLALNTLRDAPNDLRVLHRGRVRCTQVPAWPVPSHADESDAVNALSSVYGSLFTVQNGDVVCSNSLTTENSGEHAQRVIPVHRQAVRTPLAPDFEPPAGDGYVPFTTWTVHVEHEGLYLAAFELEFSGETYDHLLASDQPFTIDGPDRLLARIEYIDLASLIPDERGLWTERLAPFTDLAQRVPCEKYDIIVLSPPYADQTRKVTGYSANGIYEVFTPALCGGTLYSTLDSTFTLPLQFKGIAPSTTCAPLRAVMV